MVAFAVQPHIGCVWPFYSPVRGTYTVVAEPGRLVATTKARSYFSGFTSNVLTGPLHGLMIAASTLRALVLGDDFDSSAQSSPALAADALGAQLGLRALRSGLRNVAVRAVRCDWTPGPLQLPGAVPSIDPYV
jgi:hypothetical protein